MAVNRRKTKEQKCESVFHFRPAFPEEAGLFYALTPEKDEAMGTVGHIRIDFGYSGKEFWHSWHPRGPEVLNSPEFQEELTRLVNELRENGPLKDFNSISSYCSSHGGVIKGGWVQNYGYIAETEHYRYCLRCNPVKGDYQCYLTAFDLRAQQLWQEDHPVGKIAFVSGEEEIFTDPQKYLDAVREELPFMTTTGFRYQTLTQDPRVRKAVDDILLDFAGEENSFKLEDYGLTEEGKKALRDAADPNLTHTYNWYVITNCGSPKEQIQQDMTMEEAIRVYQDTDEKEKRLGVTKDEIATVDLVRLADCEQQFFGDYQVMDCFKDDPVILQAVQMLHQVLGEENPVQGMTMGGI